MGIEFFDDASKIDERPSKTIYLVDNDYLHPVVPYFAEQSLQRLAGVNYFFR